MFITFEGMDGSGKTTQVNLTAEHLTAQGYDVLLTREPGGTALGDRIRELLLDKDSGAISPRAELLLFNASRAQLVASVIRPHLERGGVVICDRYIDSSVAYQGYGHGIAVQDVIDTVRVATGGLMPDITLFLDIAPEVALQRRAAASLFGEEMTRIDSMELAYHRRVYQGYQDIGAAEGGRWVRIDATLSPEVVQRRIAEALRKRLPKPRRRR